MADTETTIKIGADDSGLKKIAESSKKAFDAKRVNDLRRAAKDLEGDLGSLAKKQADVVKKLLGVEKGTDHYKELGRELKHVQREADAVRRVLDDVNRVTEKGRKSRQGFFAGLGQGAGLGQYIPSERGMVPRMAGQAIGGFGRRVGRGISAPFMMPGVGGFAGALSAIPFLGPALSGIMMQGQGYAQQAIEFSKSKVQNVAYADIDSVGRRRRRWVPSGSRMESVLKAARTGETDKLLTEAGAGPLPKVGASGVLGEAETARLAKAGKLQFALSPGAERAVMVAEQNMKRVEMTPTKRRPAAGTAGAGKWVNYREDVTGVPSAGFGARMGFGAEETQSFFGQMFQGRGGTGGRSSTMRQAHIKEALGISRLYGVSGAQAGSFYRMMMPGAGAGGESMTMGEAVASAEAQKLRGSQVVEYLQQLVQQGKKMEQEGIKFDPRSLTAAPALFRGLGLQGLQATRVGMGMRTAAQGVSARGVSSPMDVLLARAAGFQPGGGPESYAKAMEALEDPSVDVMGKVVGSITSGAKGHGRGPAFTAMLVKRAFRQMNIPIGFEQARTMMGRTEGGEMTAEARDEMKRVMEATPRDYAARAQMGVGKVAPLAAAQASHQAAQIGAGAGLAGTFMKMDKIGLKAVTTLTRFQGALNKAADFVLDKFGDLDSYLSTFGDGS